jgi:lipoprotein-anchoring transpeptidase ErfK/SrfK
LAALVAASALILSALGLVIVLAPATSSSANEPEGVALDALDLPPSPPPALKVPTPVALAASKHASYWATVLKSVAVRSEPATDAPVVAHLETTTPENTSNIVLVLERADDSAGVLWVHVRLPVLPNDTTGWVPRDALGVYGVVHTRLVVDLERLTATLFREGRAIFRADVGVGQSQWPTPTGNFYIRNKLVSFRSPVYGPLAFGTSARSDTLTDWPAGGFVGIHGTNQPEILPGRISHGCIRLRNEDILELGRLMPVGTPLTIR